MPALRLRTPFHDTDHPRAGRGPGSHVMAKTQRKLKKANHGKRPASAQARRAKRRGIKT